MRKGDRVTAETGQNFFFLQESTEERTDSRAEETREKGNKEAGIESPLYKNRSVFFFSFELSKQQRQQWLCHKRFLILFNCKSNTHTHTQWQTHTHTHTEFWGQKDCLFLFSFSRPAADLWESRTQTDSAAGAAGCCCFSVCWLVF